MELLDELGRGAHGAVYRARRGSEYYAVKVALAPSDPSAFVRFQREAIALARAKHPGLPRVLDVAKSGAPYLVMELVEGETLAARLSRGTLSEEETRALGLQLADVLAHIHRLGLVHRDVKPRNIIFDEKSGRARIVDFGIAIGTASNNFAAAEGTVPYAAPEQLRGLSIDGRADLYSLGCVLYECLCGMPPLGPLSLERLGKGDPTSDEARLERANISSEFTRLVARLTSQEAKDRASDAGEVANQLMDELERSSKGAGLLAPRANPGILVGRDRELAALTRARVEARQGDQQTLIIEGPIGSGKTALLHNFCDRTRTEGDAAVYVPCASYDPVPFSVVRRLFDMLLDLLGEQKFRETVGEFASLLTVISPTLGRVFPDAPAVPDSDDAHHVILESAFKCLAKLLALGTAATVCVDDCQWIDAGSATILRKLVGARGVPVLLVLAYRDQLSSKGDPLFAGAVERPPSIALGALDDGARAQIVAAYLGAQSLPEELVDNVTALTAPTPLSVLEGLRTFLEERAILPGWDGWRLQKDAAERVHLPDTIIETLRARIAGLEKVVPEVLRAAAVVGMEFEVCLLPEIAGVPGEEVVAALREACRAALITGSGARYRFVHQAVRDALLAACTEGKLRDLNGRAAEVLDREFRAVGRSDPELIYRVADLYWRGEWSYTPGRAVAVIEQAAQQAFEAFDNRKALQFLEQAEEIRRVENMQPNGDTIYLTGELLVRLGSLAAGQALLERALSLPCDPLRKATILSRIARVHEWQLDSARAWDALRRAFVALGVPLPDTTPISLAKSARAWVRATTGRVRHSADDVKKRQAILCVLYYRTFRVGWLSANVPQTIQAAVLGLEAAQSLGVSAALSKAYLAYAMVLTALGQRERGRSYLRQGEDVARATRDPVAIAHSVQMHSAIASWDGNVAEALEVGGRCLLEHGHWQDFSEHCLLAYNQRVLECMRGRGYEELRWLEHVIRQVELHPEAYGLFEFIELGARALLVHLGRDHEAAHLLARLREVTVKIPESSSHFVFGFGPRARALSDSGNFGPAMDALEAEFRHGRHDPRRVHLGVVEFYVHLAHARVHGCIRASESEAPRRLLDLRRAAADLRLAARIPLIRAHSLVVDAYLAHFEGYDEKASRLFAEADALAIEEEAPWVRYAVARGRAHHFKARNHTEIVQSEAETAERIARENGAVHRLRWVREEFGLPQTSAVFKVPLRRGSIDTGKSSSVSSLGRQPRRRSVRASTRLPSDAASTSEKRRSDLLEELISGLGVSEVHLYLRSADSSFQWSSGRAHAREVVAPPQKDAFVQEVGSRRVAAVIDDTELMLSRLAVPLFERGKVFAVVYAHVAGCGAFDDEDCEYVASLVEHFTLETQNGGSSLGRFVDEASGIPRSASELANLLAKHVEHLAAEEPYESGEVLSRATAITRLLRDTGRLECCEPALANVNEVIARLHQRISAVSGRQLELLSALDSTVNPIYIDPVHLELIVLHCVLGARLRLVQPGALIVETTNVIIDTPVSAHGAQQLREGTYVMLTLSMVPDSSSDLEEERRSSRVIGFGDLAKQVCAEAAASNGGAILLWHEDVTGCNVQLVFPSAVTSGDQREDAATVEGQTVLFVDRDESLRSRVAHGLRASGYRVLLAEDEQSATTVLEIHNGSVDLIVREVALDSVQERGGHGRPVLYVSSYPWNALRAVGIAVPRAQFLQKPFSARWLAASIRKILASHQPRVANLG